ncbi:MAG TPA: hypothetical protein VMZ90_10585 [Vicinamibacterales bacterium]|nr:hypothetical protein [Vicinamibacterales bacterium]
MKRVLYLLAVLAAATACGRPTGPSETGQDRFTILAPASASVDLGLMFTEAGAAQWVQARSKLRGLQFYQQSLRRSCPTCGGNNLERLVASRPGGPFAWLSSQGIQIGVEAGAIKEHTCNGRELGRVALEDVAPVYAAGSQVTFIAMDEPFTAALPSTDTSPLAHCEFDINRTVIEVKAFVDTVHERYPGILIGLIEPYPYFTMENIITFIGALQNAGVRLPFFRIDFDLRHRRNTDANASADLKRLRSVLADLGIEFELIVTGYDGKTDAGAVASAMALAYEVSGAVGRPQSVVFQDWSADRLGGSSTAVNLPEGQVGSLTWLLNNGVEVFR